MRQKEYVGRNLPGKTKQNRRTVNGTIKGKSHVFFLSYDGFTLAPLRTSTCIRILSPRLGDIVDSGIWLSYRPASLCSLAGQYAIPMPESTMSPSQGLRIWPLLYDEKKECERRKGEAVSAEVGGLVLGRIRRQQKKSRPVQIFYSRNDSKSTKNRKETLPTMFTLNDKWCILLFLCICVQCTCC